MTHDEMIAVIQAHKEGKRIQARSKTSIERDWCDCYTFLWDFAAFEYRINPEPLELWVNVYPSGSVYAYLSREAAEKNVSFEGRVVHMREVEPAQ